MKRHYMQAPGRARKVWIDDNPPRLLIHLASASCDIDQYGYNEPPPWDKSGGTSFVSGCSMAFGHAAARVLGFRVIMLISSRYRAGALVLTQLGPDQAGST